MAREITTDVYGVTRLKNTVNGNPRFTLHTTDGDFTIGSDASCAYEVTNYTNAIPYGGSIRLRLKLTKAGRFWDLERAD